MRIAGVHAAAPLSRPNGCHCRQPRRSRSISADDSRVDIARSELGSGGSGATQFSGKSSSPLIVTTVEEALSFVREHGVVLASAKGPAPRLTELVTGEPIRGSWWAHPKSHQIFAIFQAISESRDILTCRLINGKLTLVHRRLWPALVRAADCFSAYQLAQVHQQHTPSGHHLSHEVPFPEWVPREVLEESQHLSEQEARSAVGAWAALRTDALKPTGRKRYGRRVS